MARKKFRGYAPLYFLNIVTRPALLTRGLFIVVSRTQWVKTTSSMRTESHESMKNSFTTVTKMTLLSGQQKYERLGTKNSDVAEGGVGRWG